MNATEMFVAVLIPLGFFLLVFGVVYMYKKENLAMIEKGMNPKTNYTQPAPYKNLKWALLLAGSGAGLCLAFVLDNYVFNPGRYHDNNGSVAAIYFGLIAIGGGLGLFGSYKLEKEWMEKKERERERMKQE